MTGQPKSRLGAGPTMGTAAGVYMIAAWVASAYLPNVTRLDWPPPFIWRLAGTALIGTGTVIYIWALYRLWIAELRGVLAQTGPYRYVRHPAYAAWLWFIVPGLACFSRSWPVLLTPVVFYLVARVFLPKEEAALAKRHDGLWDDYCARTGRLFPHFRSRQTNSF